MFDIAKIVIIGDEGVGKTKIVESLQCRPFDFKYEPTNRVNVSCLKKDNDNWIHVFDCGGSEKNLLYAGQDWIDASVAIIVFDLSTRSWKNIFQWVDDVRAILGNDTPIIIVGAKSDLPSPYVDKGMIARGLFSLRRENRVVRYIETSSKTGQNCDKFLQLLGEYI